MLWGVCVSPHKPRCVSPHNPSEATLSLCACNPSVGGVFFLPLAITRLTLPRFGGGFFFVCVFGITRLTLPRVFLGGAVVGLCGLLRWLTLDLGPLTPPKGGGGCTLFFIRLKKWGRFDLGCCWFDLGLRARADLDLEAFVKALTRTRSHLSLSLFFFKNKDDNQIFARAFYYYCFHRNDFDILFSRLDDLFPVVSRLPHLGIEKIKACPYRVLDPCAVHNPLFGHVIAASYIKKGTAHPSESVGVRHVYL